MILLFSVSSAFAEDLKYEIIARSAFGRVDDVAYLLEKGANANTFNDADQPLTVIAARRKDPEGVKIMKLLVENGADFNVREPNGDNALIAAIKSGSPETVEYLISLLPAMRSVDARNKTLTELAAERDDTKIIELVKNATEDEDKRIKIFQSDKNFRKLVTDYAANTCGQAYLQFYLRFDDTRDFPDEHYIDRIAIHKSKGDEALSRLSYFFSLSSYEHKDIAYKAAKSIIGELQDYPREFERVLDNIGTEKDVENRCRKIGENMSRRLRRKTAK